MLIALASEEDQNPFLIVRYHLRSLCSSSRAIYKWSGLHSLKELRRLNKSF